MNQPSGINQRIDDFLTQERQIREQAMQRWSGVWVTVDGGSHQERRAVARVAADALLSLGFAQVQERRDPDAKRVPMQRLKDEELREIANHNPTLPGQPVTFVVPEHNPQLGPLQQSDASNVYSGRAECMDDINRVLAALSWPDQGQPMVRHGLIGTSMEYGYLHPDSRSGEVMVELRFLQPVDREVIEKAILSVADTHVLYQTLLPIPLVNNPCIRNREKD